MAPMKFSKTTAEKAKNRSQKEFDNVQYIRLVMRIPFGRKYSKLVSSKV